MKIKKLTSFIITIVITIVIIYAGAKLIDYRLASPPKAEIEPRDELRMRHVDSHIPLTVDAEVWDEIEWKKIHLLPQSARSPHGYSEKELWVKAAYNETDVAFLLRFDDDTEDRKPPQDPDACAVLFSPVQSQETVQMMGYGGEANVWQWLANRDAERYLRNNESMNAVRELIASGPGTQTPFEKQNTDGRGIYEDGRWTVILRRPIKANQEGEFDFMPGEEKKVAFALWNGSNMESFSRKSISILRTLILEKA